MFSPEMANITRINVGACMNAQIHTSLSGPVQIVSRDRLGYSELDYNHDQSSRVAHQNPAQLAPNLNVWGCLVPLGGEPNESRICFTDRKKTYTIGKGQRADFGPQDLGYRTSGAMSKSSQILLCLMISFIFLTIIFLQATYTARYGGTTRGTPP